MYSEDCYGSMLRKDEIPVELRTQVKDMRQELIGTTDFYFYVF